MLNPPPKTGDTALDKFLRGVYEQSQDLEAKAIPENGWSLTDFTAEVSGVIGDKRDLIDIVTQYDSIEDYLALVDDQKQLLEDALTKVESIEVSADWFAQIMEWWDQNYKIIQDAQESLKYKREADAAALEAKGYAAETEEDRLAAARSLADAQEAASDAASYRQGALTYRDSSKRYSEASDAAKGFAEAAQALAEDFRDGAKAHREAAKVSETNAEASASAASTDANKAKGSATEAAGEVTKAESARAQVEAVETALRALMADTEAWQDVSFALESVDGRISEGMQAVKNDILGGVGPAFDTLLELAEALGDNADAISTLTNELAKKAEKGHTHVSADITDSVGYMGSSGYGGRLVRTGSTGHIHVGTMPSEDNHLSRKGYVDQEVAKKANTNHTHTISETSGLQTALDGKAPESHIHAIKDVDGLNAALEARSVDGHKHTSADITDTTEAAKETAKGSVMKVGSDGFIRQWGDPTDTDHVVNKKYVDTEISTEIEEAIDLLPRGRNLFQDPSFEKGTDSSATEVTDARSGTHVSRLDASKWNSGGQRPAFFTGGEPRTYEAVYWLRAVNKPEGYSGGATIGLRFRREDLRGNYLGELYPPTDSLKRIHSLTGEWTQHRQVTPVTTEHEALKPYFVLSGGEELAGAFVDLDDVFLADITDRVQTEELNSDFLKHKHVSADITDAVDHIHGGRAGRLVVVGEHGHIRDGNPPTNQYDLPNKAYVDTEVSKKANANHAHGAEDIADRTNIIGTESAASDMLRANSGGWIEIDSNPTDSRHPARKSYVDSEVAKKADTGHKHDWSDITGNSPADLGYNSKHAEDEAMSYPVGFSYAMSNGVTYGWNEAIREGVPDASASSFVMIQTMRHRTYSGSTTQIVYSYNNEHRPIYVRNWDHGDNVWGPFRSLTDDGHKHAISDVNGLQSAIDEAAGAATWSELEGKPSTFPPSTHSHSWSQITGKPSTFKPESHSHSISQVTGLQAALDAKAAATHSHSWSQITGKPDVATESYVNSRPAIFSGPRDAPGTIPGAVIGDYWLNEVTMELAKIVQV